MHRKEIVMFPKTLHSLFVGLLSTAVGVCLTAVATSSSPAIAGSPFMPIAGVTVL